MDKLQQLPTARWADKIIVRTNATNDDEAVIRKKLSGPLPDPFGVGMHELRKTAFEIQVIKQSAFFLETILAAVNQPPRGIDVSRVHFLDLPNYRLFLGSGNDGQTMLGHCYLTRRPEDTAAEVFMLTHELAHLASFLSIISESDDTTRRVTWKRSGYAIQIRNRGTAFSGLNEAAAEILAGIVREMLTRKCSLLDKPTKKLLSKGYIYAPQVRIVQELNRLISEHEQLDDGAVLMSFISGFLNGKVHFLRFAERVVPGASSILRAMGDSPNAALVAARALNLTDIIEPIEEFVESQYGLQKNEND
ncbi:MAG: hypothetical protein V1738_01385 [Patescibacteria group bacterium]